MMDACHKIGGACMADKLLFQEQWGCAAHSHDPIRIFIGRRIWRHTAFRAVRHYLISELFGSFQHIRCIDAAGAAEKFDLLAQFFFDH